MLINNQLTSDPTIIVNKFNEFFVNVGPNLSSKIGPSNADIKDFLQPSVSNSIVMHPTDKVEVRNIIKELKDKSSPGLDCIPNSVIKFAVDFIAAALSNIINSSLIHGYFPDRLKMAKVIPVYKSGDSSLLTNYRPIYILNFFLQNI